MALILRNPALDAATRAALKGIEAKKAEMAAIADTANTRRVDVARVAGSDGAIGSDHS